MGCALQDKLMKIDKEKLIVGQQKWQTIEIVQTSLSVTVIVWQIKREKKKKEMCSFFPAWNAYFACYALLEAYTYIRFPLFSPFYIFLIRKEDELK